jgi:ribosome-associated protein
LAGRKVTDEGVLLIKADRFRTQVKNRQDAINRLVELIREAAKEPKIRRKTKPSAASTRRVMETKRRRSNVKQQRRPVKTTDD